MVIYWAYSLWDGVAALPMGQELAITAGDEEKHSVTQLELSGLYWARVSPLMFPLCHLHMLLHDGHHPLYLVLYVLNNGVEWCGLVLPGLFGHV